MVLVVNVEMTKNMKSSRDRRHFESVRIGANKAEAVQDFTDLGSSVNIFNTIFEGKIVGFLLLH